MNKCVTIIIALAAFYYCECQDTDEKKCTDQTVSSSYSSCNDIGSIFVEKTYACCWVEKKEEGKDKKTQSCLYVKFDLTSIEAKQTELEAQKNTNVIIFCSKYFLSLGLLFVLVILIL